MLREALLTMSRKRSAQGPGHTVARVEWTWCRASSRARTPTTRFGSRARSSSRDCTALDHLGEDTTDVEHATAVADAYLTVLGRLADAGLTSGTEVSVKLSAVGQALPGDGEKIALDNALQICAAARTAGTTVTFDMENHTTTDSTLDRP